MSAFIDERRGDFGVELMCRTLGLSASAYYERATGRRSARAVEDERLLEVIKKTHAANYEAYGSRRMWKQLRRQGETAPRCQVERLMAANAIVGAKRRGRPWRTTVQGAEPVTSPDLLDRDFSATRPDEKWCADFTYIRCWEGVVFFSFVIDCYSRMVVGWQFAGHMRTELVADALKNAAATTLIEPDAIWHSDRGSVYTSAGFRALVTGLGMRSSMGRTGVCWDNSMAESFFSMLKNERVYRTVYATKSQARSDVIRYIEGFYNSRRRHSALGYRRPNEVHYGYQQPALAA